jgi:hypothetical protein
VHAWAPRSYHHPPTEHIITAAFASDAIELPNGQQVILQHELYAKHFLVEAMQMLRRTRPLTPSMVVLASCGCLTMMELFATLALSEGRGSTTLDYRLMSCSTCGYYPSKILHSSSVAPSNAASITNAARFASRLSWRAHHSGLTIRDCCCLIKCCFGLAGPSIRQ